MHDMIYPFESNEEDTSIKMALICYQQAVERGISRYEKRFTSEAIPLHRAQDATYIRGLLQQDYPTEDDLRDAVQAYLEKMFTGFWFIRTGRSRLRCDIEAATALCDPVRALSTELLKVASRKVKEKPYVSAVIEIPLRSGNIQEIEDSKSKGHGKDALRDKGKQRCHSREKKGEERKGKYRGDTAYQQRQLEELEAVGLFASHSSYTRKEIIARTEGKEPETRVNSFPDIFSPYSSSDSSPDGSPHNGF